MTAAIISFVTSERFIGSTLFFTVVLLVRRAWQASDAKRRLLQTKVEEAFEELRLPPASDPRWEPVDGHYAASVHHYQIGPVSISRNDVKVGDVVIFPRGKVDFEKERDVVQDRFWRIHERHERETLAKAEEELRRFQLTEQQGPFGRSGLPPKEGA